MGELTDHWARRGLIALGGGIISAFGPSVVPDKYEPWLVAVGLATIVGALAWPYLARWPGGFLKRHVVWRFQPRFPQVPVAALAGVQPLPPESPAPDQEIAEVEEPEGVSRAERKVNALLRRETLTDVQRSIAGHWERAQACQQGAVTHFQEYPGRLQKFEQQEMKGGGVEVVRQPIRDAILQTLDSLGEIEHEYQSLGYEPISMRSAHLFTSNPHVPVEGEPPGLDQDREMEGEFRKLAAHMKYAEIMMRNIRSRIGNERSKVDQTLREG